MGSGKIAIFMQDLAGGGAERVMVQLAGGMVEQGQDVDLVLVRPEGPYLSMVPSEVRIMDLGTRRTLWSIPPLARYLRRERPAALLAALVHVNIAAILAARLAGCGTHVVVSEHNQISRNAANFSNPAIWFAHRLVPRLYPWASNIVAVSRGVADDLARFSGLPTDRIDVVYNPVVTPELHRMASERVDHPWFVGDEPPVILGVGRLTAQKDFTTLIRAFVEVRRQRPARLVILGEGPRRQELEQMIGEFGLQGDVDLPGFAQNPYALMASASLFALSSAWEGLPTVLVEAMACGTPVVATDCPSGPAEILEKGRFGPLVPVGDHVALAQAIVQTLSSPLDAERLRRRAGDFSVERSVAQYKSILFAEPNR